MSDDICVNIYSGINRVTGSMINRIFQSAGLEQQDSSIGTLFAALMVLLAIVMIAMQSQQRKAVETDQKSRYAVGLQRDNSLN